ncbi:PTPRB-like protein [Mya arenaria]|uniref:PTPRB-like protein n=1 Tax=Mya arenaria TaxID=6604 RepID=A0ABY7EG54_MYAAR|nr:PTPRB-like protein [Mya arenaria]
MLKASVSVDNDEKQIAVALPLAQFLCNTSNGPPTMWGIVVAEADEAARDTAFAGSRDDFQKKIDDTYMNWFLVDGLNNIPPYIATKPNWKPPCANRNRRKRSSTDGSNIFVIGNDACHGPSTTKEYCNGPLPDGRSFKYMAPNMTAAFVGGAVSAVVVLVLVVLVVFLMRRRQAACFKKDTESITHTSSERFVEMGAIQTIALPGAVYLHGPVKLTEFPAFVEKMHRDSDLLFADAYKGYTSPRAYIATQGPMQATFDDFWRMVWEQNVDTIVMLTKLVENGRIKCDKYWPDVYKPKYYGDLVVSVTSESNLSDYTLRIFEIKLKGERRSVRQFAYLKWPDMGCPEFPEMLLEFLETDQFIFIHECLKACITSDRNYEEVEEHMYEQLTIMGRQHLQC